MDEIEVKVAIWDRGRTREAVVSVPSSAFQTKCWRTIAALAAAVELEIPFQEMEARCKYGLRPADKRRLEELCGQGTGETDSSLRSE
jgi:hypothetical protein